MFVVPRVSVASSISARSAIELPFASDILRARTINADFIKTVRVSLSLFLVVVQLGKDLSLRSK
jgi:hypothetical protein